MSHHVARQLRKNPFWAEIQKVLNEAGYNLYTADRKSSGDFLVEIQTVQGRIKYTFPERGQSFTVLNFKSRFRNWLADQRQRGFVPPPDHRTRQPGQAFKLAQNGAPQRPQEIATPVTEAERVFAPKEPELDEAERRLLEMSQQLEQQDTEKRSEIVEAPGAARAVEAQEPSLPQRQTEAVPPAHQSPRAVPRPEQREAFMEQPAGREDLAVLFAVSSEDLADILVMLKGRARMIRSRPLSEVQHSLPPLKKPAGPAQVPERRVEHHHHHARHTGSTMEERILATMGANPQKIFDARDLHRNMPEYTRGSIMTMLAWLCKGEKIERLDRGQYCIIEKKKP